MLGRKEKMKLWRAAALMLPLLVAACQEPQPAVRPDSQPLEALKGLPPSADAEGGLGLPTTGAQAENVCAEVIRASERAGLITDRSDPGSLEVDENLWARLPPEVAGHIARCAETLRPEGETGRVTVVDRRGQAVPAP